MAVKGIGISIQALKELSREIQQEVKDAVEDTTLDIERQAIMNAPDAGTQLKTTWGSQTNEENIQQFIRSEFDNDGFTGRVYIMSSASLLAVYIEFGTGIWARNYLPSLPMDIQRIARRYFINGRGTLVNAPFLMPAYFQHSPELIKKVKTILEKKA